MDYIRKYDIELEKEQYYAGEILRGWVVIENAENLRITGALISDARGNRLTLKVSTRPKFCSRLIFRFLPHDAMHSAVLVIVNVSFCVLSVCPSVCLSHSWTMSTWFDLRS